VFVTVGHFHPILLFADKAGAPYTLHFKGKLIVVPSNIRLGWKLLSKTNTLSYYDTELITLVKKFYSTGPWP